MKSVERLGNCGQKQQQRGAKLQCQNLKHTVTGEGVGKGCTQPLKKARQLLKKIPQSVKRCPENAHTKWILLEWLKTKQTAGRREGKGVP